MSIVHRTGRTGAPAIGDASVVIPVSAPHRAEAFEACRHGIEARKKMAPIWWAGPHDERVIEYDEDVLAALDQEDDFP